jgi:hypothetical protein
MTLTAVSRESLGSKIKVIWAPPSACSSQRNASESGAHSVEVLDLPAIGLGSCQTRQRTPSLCFPGLLATGHHTPLYDVPLGGLCTRRRL